jgi:hypothetical protein
MNKRLAYRVIQNGVTIGYDLYLSANQMRIINSCLMYVNNNCHFNTKIDDNTLSKIIENIDQAIPKGCTTQENTYNSFDILKQAESILNSKREGAENE